MSSYKNVSVGISGVPQGDVMGIFGYYGQNKLKFDG